MKTTPRVLIVDDDPTLLKFCQRVLEKASFDVTAINDSTVALSELRSEMYDLLLTDILMPVMDGFELATQGKKIQPDMAVLMMTGQGTLETALQALTRGIDDLILKPFSGGKYLVETVGKVLHQNQQKLDAARLQILRPLFAVSEDLFLEVELSTLYEKINQSMKQLLETAQVYVFLENAAGTTQRIIGEFSDKQSEWEKVIKEWLVKSGQSHDTFHVRYHPEPGNHWMEALSALNWDEIAIVSVQRAARKVIFFVARDHGKSNFSEADLELFAILARQSAVALENADLHSEQRLHIRKVEESQAALVQAEKLAAVGRLTAAMSHEINNPLQSIQNCLHLALRMDIEDAQRREFIEVANQEVERLAKMVQNRLDFYRPSRPQKELVNAADLVRYVIDFISVQLRHQMVKVEFQAAQEPIYIRVVRDQIQQVVFNILLNAIDALGEIDTQRIIWIDLDKNDNFARFIFEDNGPGIPTEIHQRIFEPFFTARKKKGGTGLGLSISLELVESYHGTLRLVSPRREHGACFEVKIPMGLDED